MSRPNYVIPDNPVYDPEIPALLDEDPASASQVFNPLFQRLINNTHAVQLLFAVLRSQLMAITGYDISGAVGAFYELPPAGGFPVGTLFLVHADETREGRTTVYRVGEGSEWVFVAVLESYESRLNEIQNQLDRLLQLIQNQRPGYVLENGEMKDASMRLENGEIHPLAVRDK